MKELQISEVTRFSFLLPEQEERLIEGIMYDYEGWVDTHQKNNRNKVFPNILFHFNNYTHNEYFWALEHHHFQKEIQEGLCINEIQDIYPERSEQLTDLFYRDIHLTFSWYRFAGWNERDELMNPPFVEVW